MKRKLKICRRDLVWKKKFIQSFHVDRIGRHHSVEKELRLNIAESAEHFVSGLDTEQCYINDKYHNDLE